MDLYNEYHEKYKKLYGNGKKKDVCEEFFWIGMRFLEDRNIDYNDPLEMGELYLKLVSTNNEKMLITIEQMLLQLRIERQMDN